MWKMAFNSRSTATKSMNEHNHIDDIIYDLIQTSKSITIDFLLLHLFYWFYSNNQKPVFQNPP